MQSADHNLQAHSAVNNTSANQSVTNQQSSSSWKTTYNNKQFSFNFVKFSRVFKSKNKFKNKLKNWFKNWQINAACKLVISEWLLIRMCHMFKQWNLFSIEIQSQVIICVFWRSEQIAEQMQKVKEVSEKSFKTETAVKHTCKTAASFMNKQSRSKQHNIFIAENSYQIKKRC